jgi:hypothetical protein
MSVNRHFSARRKKCDQEEAKDLLKYEELTTEIKCMWHATTKVTIITGATGKISESF